MLWNKTMASGNTVKILTMGIAIGFLLSALLLYIPLHPGAWAQSEVTLESKPSIQAFSVMLNRDNQGIAMIDVNEKTIWVYEVTTRRLGAEQIRLIAARSWEHDRKLKEWNCGQPVPGQIKQLLDNLSQEEQAAQEQSVKEIINPNQ